MARILVVDDDLQNRYLLEVLFGHRGHEVTVASDGAQALESALKSPPDLVISDLLMPVMDGFSLCRRWKTDERLKSIPFVVYTATYVESKDEELALSLGADRFITKPEEPETLMKAIDEVLASPSARPAGAHRLEDPMVLQMYSEALFHKLEKKMAELEAKNLRLEKTVEERMKAEQALRVSEAEYRIVADNTYSWEFWLDVQGRFRYISPSCKRITGRDRREFIDDPTLLWGILHPDDRAKFSAHADGIEKLQGEGTLEFRILYPDGSQRWIAHNCAPVLDHDGVWIGTRGSNRDITEQKRLEAQLHHAQKMEAIGQLAGGVAHDFNNILTAILGYTSILRMQTKPDDPRKEHLEEIVAAAERASTLTNNLLTFSRKQEVKLRPVDLNDLIRAVGKFLTRIIGEHIEVHTSLTTEPLAVLADGGQIEQVLVNLVTNARDAMPEGGTLTIETDMVQIDGDFIRMHGYGTQGRYAMVSVTDTGTGMDEETRQKIFEPFFTTKETGKGTGLGLSIAYGIVKQHGGYINVYSEPGRGTTFRLLFQCIEAQGAGQPGAVAGTRESKAGSQAEAEQGGGETILVVDDDAAIRRLLDLYLSSVGYKVFQAADGQEGVEKFQSMANAIDLVVMDTIMPRKNGKEAALAMRTVRPDIKIILMSGYPSDIIQRQGLQAEGIEFLLKPLRPSEFAAKVKEVLRRK